MRMLCATVAGLALAGTVPGQFPSAIRSAEALGARTGVAVLDLGNKTPVLLHRPEEAFIPASNMKILTAAAAVAGLGFDHQFETRFRLRDGILEVIAGGDPNWETGSAHDPSALFGQVTQALQQAGIEAVREIRLQPGTFTGPTRPPTWPADQLETWYCAPTGGFVLDAGCVRIRVVPSTGSTATVQVLAPMPGAAVEGRITMVQQKNAVYGIRDLGGRLVVNGSMPRTPWPASHQVAVHDPQHWYERVLRARLDEAGVAVDRSAPAKDLALPTIKTPMHPALRRTLMDSSNFHAEQMVRVLGHEAGAGTLAHGMEAMARHLESLVGPLPKGTTLVDASGLSRGNQLSPRLITDVLDVSLRQTWRSALLEALPLAGDEGTVSKRFENSPVKGRVRAKTGWIRGASSLSGVVELEDGTLRVFSILMNYDPKIGGLNARLKALQERIVEQIAGLER